MKTGRLDKVGRIVIPIGIRKALELDENSDLEIMISQGNVVISPCKKSCKLCARQDVHYTDLQICNECVIKIKTI